MIIISCAVIFSHVLFMPMTYVKLLKYEAALGLPLFSFERKLVESVVFPATRNIRGTLSGSAPGVELVSTRSAPRNGRSQAAQ